MGIQFITGSSGSGKTEYVCNYASKQSYEDGDCSIVFVVPEQYTMSTQRKLVTTNKRHGILNIDVVSFQRLAFKVFEEIGGDNKSVLDETGKNLIVRLVLEKHRKELEYFGNGINKTGFVSQIKSVISELMQYGIEPDILLSINEKFTEKQQIYYKLKDIQIIYKAFMEYLSDKYITPEEILDVLCTVLDKSELVKKSEFIFDGFTGFTPVQYKILRQLLIYSKNVKITATIDAFQKINVYKGKSELFFMSKEMYHKISKICEEERIIPDSEIILGKDKNYRFENAPDLEFLEKNFLRYNKNAYKKEPENICIFEASSPKEEIQYITSRILELTRKEDFAYKDIAVVTGDMDTYGKLAENIFLQNDIRSFLDLKKSIADNLFVEFINSALEIVYKGYNYDAVFRFIRSGFVPITQKQMDIIENYCIGVGIRGRNAWQNVWRRKLRNKNRQPDIAELNECRKKIITPFVKLEKTLKNKNSTVRDYVTALYYFILEFNCQEKIEKLTQDKETGREYEQLYKKIMDLFNRIVELLGDEKVTLKEFSHILEAGFEEIKVGLLPPTSDCIIIGDIERTRLDNVKIIFFAGINDGIIPKKGENTGVLSQMDRNALEDKEIVLSPTVREKAFIQKFYLYLIMTKASDKLYLSYSRKDDNGKVLLPSYIIRNIKNMFPYIKITDSDISQTSLKYLKIPKAETQWSVENYIKALSELSVTLLYNDDITGSISSFERFASCHFAYFVQYGLGLEEREEYKFEANDYGTVMHEVLEDITKTLKEQKKSLSLINEEERKKLVTDSLEKISQQYGNNILKDTYRNEFMVKRMTQIADRTLWAIGKQLEKGEFAPDVIEQSFIVDEHEVSGKKKLHMKGRIDRVDVCEDEENVYVRVIDYKTGNSDFDLLKTYYGLKLQLITYMKAAKKLQEEKHPGKNIIPAGILYYNINDPIIDISDNGNTDELSDEEIKDFVDKKILEDLKMKGVVNSSKNIIKKMDSIEEGKSAVIPVGFKKNGEPDAHSHIYSTERFNMLEEYISEISSEIAGKIFSGDIEINPYKNKNDDSCEYCQYSGVCGFSSDINCNGKRNLKKLKDDEVWSKIAERTEKNGQ